MKLEKSEFLISHSLLSKNQHVNRCHEEFRKQTDYISTVFIHTKRAGAGALLVSLQVWGPMKWNLRFSSSVRWSLSMGSL